MPCRRCIFLPFALASAAVVLGLPAACRAQQQAVVTRAVPPASLGDALHSSSFKWDARENGVLLWININPEAEPARLRKRAGFAGEQKPRLAEPEANGYRIQDLAATFDRRVVVAGRVTVLAPTLTTMLATALPKPDLYADLPLSEKLRRLESTLTPAQWRLIGSPDGLGEGDLRSTQKSLWASLLPEPLILERSSNKNGKSLRIYEESPAATPLTNAQRRGVRLTLYRTFTWNFATTDTTRPFSGLRTVYVGTPLATAPDGTVSLSLRDVVQHYSDDAQVRLFGVVVKDAVPTRPKPSELAYDHASLDAVISLAETKTVGEWVARAKEKTHVDLFCDPRYRSLAVSTLGGETQSVRAGDLLQALAAGVSGTFRRVSDGKSAAYVLTDDLEGLGTRHGRIAEWAQAASAQREAEDALMEASLAKTSIGDYVGWRDDDPTAPTGALAQQIEDYRTGKAVSVNAEKPDALFPGLWVSVSDLPLSAQNLVKQQIESWNQSMAEEQSRPSPPVFPMYASPLYSNRVKLYVNTGTAFLIPGLGRVEANGQSDGSQGQDLLPPPSFQAPRATTRPPQAGAQPVLPEEAPPFRLSQAGGTVRALLIALPQNEETAKNAVSAAKARGFNELWVEMPLRQKPPEMLTETIAAAKANDVGVQAVVRVLRRPAEVNPELPRDINLLGETTSQWASRQAAITTFDAAVKGSLWFTAQMRNANRLNALRQKEWGDYLDGSSPAAEAAMVSDLVTLSQTPGLAGIVARDVTVPGSEPPYNWRTGLSEVEFLGYTPARRFRFLQETGTDPVDLSPLSDGSIYFPSGMSNGSKQVKLPQFPDYGLNAERSGINGESALVMAAKEAPYLWNVFRKKQAEAFWSRLQQDYAAQARKGVPLFRQNNDNRPVFNEYSVRLSWTGTWEKPAPPAPPVQAVIDAKRAQAASVKMPVVPTPQEQAVMMLETARQTSGRALLTVRYDPVLRRLRRLPALPGDTKTPDEEDGQWFVDALYDHVKFYQGGWDGMVIDLADVPLEKVLPLLRYLPAPSMASAPPVKPAKKKP